MPNMFRHIHIGMWDDMSALLSVCSATQETPWDRILARRRARFTLECFGTDFFHNPPTLAVAQITANLLLAPERFWEDWTGIP